MSVGAKFKGVGPAGGAGCVKLCLGGGYSKDGDEVCPLEVPTGFQVVSEAPARRHS